MALTTAGKPAPNARRKTDRWEVGEEYAEEFRQRWGWRGLEFGNWVRLNERSNYLKGLSHEFTNIAKGFGIEESQLGHIPGREPLSLGLGARGQGRRRIIGHYEPGGHVINLVRNSRGRALVHEWGHALDCVAGQATGSGQYWSLGPEWAEAIGSTPEYRKVSAQRNMPSRVGGRKDGYWTREVEYFARAFEVWADRRIDKKPLSKAIPDGTEADHLCKVIDRVFAEVFSGRTC